ncbi:uncharacterized protein LOC122507056 [Leptopilina heterotoma]|uniref:uncharacterized protein LOC122507056 n=1 Tax=Leptopilina heterotoma TaxID=63436 RepID=UPI001CA84541|nr:uncharacterized protein LOC122507056 [Leptopilina heterotoma]
MEVAKVSFTVMKYFGIWRPKSWTSEWSIQLYRLYSVFNITLFLTFSVSILIHIINSSESVDTLTESLIVFLTSCSSWVKIVIILLNRKKIIQFDDMFTEKCCRPRDNQETQIQQAFDYIDRFSNKI